ncbi:MAG: L,D-transpeptidase family protein [Sneathiella sp.]|nr:L,D-transpeptidase family protein [Sneathiella sp.]
MKVKALKGHSGELSFSGRHYTCALGKSGVTLDKREGDHASPAGLYPLRSVYYRADKMERPVTSLPCKKISRMDGWCDDPASEAYNVLITLPFASGHETLWREDDLYDLIVVLGHNDTPPIPGLGSCIFMHIANGNYEGTEGCIALVKKDLLELLALVSPDTQIEIIP